MGEMLKVGPIELAADGIGERSVEGRRLVFVPRGEIERVAVAHGFTAERPLVSLVLAAAFLGLALLLLLSATGLKSMWMTVGAGCIATLGAALLWTTVRRGWYLRIDTRRGARKLLLGGRLPPALRETLGSAKSRFGYDVDVSSPSD